MMARTGAAHLLDALGAHGVSGIFGLPGTQGIGIWDELRRTDAPRAVVPTSELAASFMANGAARATGRAAALIVIPGPGLAYAVAGLAEAKLDSVPLLVVVPESARRIEGGSGHESIDDAALSAPVVKASLRIDDSAQVGPMVAHALELAEAGEPGPVFLGISHRASGSTASSDRPRTVEPAAPCDMTEVAQRLRSARRPILLAGQGAFGAAAEVQMLVERLGAPVITTTSGRGVVPETHPLAVPFDAPGTPPDTLNELVDSADLILALGVKLTYNGTLGGRRRLAADRLVRIDASADVLTRAASSLRVVADCRAAVAQLLDEVAPSAWTAAEIAAARARLAALEPGTPEPPLAGGTAKELFAGLRTAVPPDWTVTTDSGYHQYLARRHHVVLQPRTFLVPTDFQSMGYGISGAVGAAIATGRGAVAVVGDGGLNMGATELLTAVRENLQLVVLVFVDGSFGLIRLQQLGRSGVESGVQISSPDLHALATAVGAGHELLADVGDAQAVFGRAVERGGVTIVEVPVGDPPNLTRMKMRGRAAAAVSTVLGPDAVARIKGRARGR
jgi:thiamine pyrophosphate-dependent acetolactate synthase large subunit-like protein